MREVANAAGSVQARYDYDPYGRQTQLSGTITADFGYAGMYLHVPSGLNLTLYRAYIPDLGRWLSRDPSDEGSGLNLYDYVTDNPNNMIDQLGLWQVTIGAGLAYAGLITFGDNSGQWNVGAYAGVGDGVFVDYDSRNEEKKCPSTTVGLKAHQEAAVTDTPYGNVDADADGELNYNLSTPEISTSIDYGVSYSNLRNEGVQIGDTLDASSNGTFSFTPDFSPNTGVGVGSFAGIGAQKFF